MQFHERGLGKRDLQQKRKKKILVNLKEYIVGAKWAGKGFFLLDKCKDKDEFNHEMV